MKLVWIALLASPALARADDAHPFGDVHLGAAVITTDPKKNTTSGGAVFADGEVGLRNGHVYISAFGGYVTKHVDAQDFEPDPRNGESFVHYRLHLVESGVRLAFRGAHVNGGIGLGYEWMVARGSEHIQPPPAYIVAFDRNYHRWDAWRLLEVHGGYTFGEHLDLFGEFTYTRPDNVPVFSLRAGVGYRF